MQSNLAQAALYTIGIPGGQYMELPAVNARPIRPFTADELA